MALIISAVIAVGFIAFGFAVAVWALLRQGRTGPARPGAAHDGGKILACVALPLVVLAVCLALTAFFYRLLPGELTWRFQPDGTPDGWVGRGMLVTLAVTSQLFLTFIALALAWGISRLTALAGTGTEASITRGTMFLTGNMLGLPQSILCFAMLDIFSYNSYRTHILPLWAFALLVMALGAVFISMYFARAIRQTWLASR